MILSIPAKTWVTPIAPFNMAENNSTYHAGLLQMLGHEHSKVQTDLIVHYVGSDQEKFNALLDIFLNGKKKDVQRSSWPLSYCVEQHPKLVMKYLRPLLKKMKLPGEHPSVKRHILRIFDTIEIPQNLHGELMNDCIINIEDPTAPIAVQAYSLGILQKLTARYPDIADEVKLIIEHRMPRATPAFASRAKKYLKAAAKL